MKYIVFLVFLFPLSVFAQGEIEFNTDRRVIYKKESAVLSWDAQGASHCSSYVDVLDSHGKWVWQFSDPWQSGSRPAKGTFEARPSDDARYYLECTVAGKKVSAHIELEVLDREKYIKGEENPRQPVVSSPSEQVLPASKPNAASSQQALDSTIPSVQATSTSSNTPNANITANPAGSAGSGAYNGGISASKDFANKEKKGNEPPKQEKGPENSNMKAESATREPKTVEDSDGDSLSDDEEKKIGSDPLNPDTDGDSYPDGVEVKNGYSPLVKATVKSVNKGTIPLKKDQKKVFDIKKSPKNNVISKSAPTKEKKVNGLKKIKKQIKPTTKTAKKVLNKKKKAPQKVDKSKKKK